jgi:hypothetical protein
MKQKSHAAASDGSGVWMSLLRLWRALVYRPEKHFMRGPGPKWREKHARISA